MNAFYRCTEIRANEIPLKVRVNHLTGVYLSKNTLDKSLAKELNQEEVSKMGKKWSPEKVSEEAEKAVESVDKDGYAVVNKKLSDVTYDDFKALRMVSSAEAYIVGLAVLTPAKLMYSGAKNLHEGIKNGEIKRTIQEVYRNPKTTGRILKEAGLNTASEIKEAVDYGIDTTYSAVKACDYLTTKLTLGAAEAVQSTVKHAAQMGASIGNRSDISEKIGQKDYLHLSDASRAVDKFYNIEGQLKKAGDSVEQTLESADYIVVKAGLGAGKAIQSGAKFVGEAATTIAGRSDLSNKIADYDLVGNFIDAVDDFYDKDGVAQVVADCSEKFGDVATRIALTVIGTTAGGLGGALAVGASSLINAGDYTDRVYQRYGQIEGKNVLVGAVIGATTAMAEKAIPIIDSKLMNSVARPVGAITKSGITNVIDNPLEAYKVGKAVGTGLVRGVEVSMFHVPEIAGKITEQLSRTELSIEDRWSEIGKNLAIDSSIGCVLGGISSYACDTMKDTGVLMREMIQDETGWSSEIVEHIENTDQYDIYKNANLHEGEVNGRTCLLKDIDLEYVDPKTGMTNAELMAKGRSPIDALTGEKIELHHAMQDHSGPFFELCENSEHGDGNHKVLHTKTENSWRNDPALKQNYQIEKREHWIARATEVQG